MDFTKNVKIKVKILGIVLILELALMFIVGYTINRQDFVSSEYQRIYVEDGEASIYGNAMASDLYKLRYYSQVALSTTEQAEKDNATKKINDAFQSLETNIAKVSDRAVSSTARELVTKMRDKESQLKSQIQPALAYRTSLDTSGISGNKAYTTFTKTADEMDAHVSTLAQVSTKATADEVNNTKELVSDEKTIEIGVLVVAVLFTLGMSAVLVREITTRIVKLSEAAEYIANGDLTHEVNDSSTDEIGELASSFDEMRRRVQESIMEIATSAEQVAAGSRNVSEASVSLSQGASEQASSVEELSSSIAEISSQTTSNAGNANRANELTNLAQEHANVGNTEMQRMLKAMEEINVSSTNISKIIKVIDEIAFQTNILALNAAVEAARAGQHGKGFAVVAEEVRNLAARSAKAAKETTDMIEGSIEKVNGGREIANRTADALNIIVSNVGEVADIVSAIAKASNEQKMALDQINQGVLQVSQVVQANSATSEEAASASAELSAQADRMKETASKFKISNSTSYSMPIISTPVSRPSVQNRSVEPLHVKGMSGARPANKRVAPGTKPKRISLTDDEDFGKY